MSFLFLISFLFNLPVFHCTYSLHYPIVLLCDFEMIICNAANTQTHYQVLKLLQHCEFSEWDSSSKAGNVTENMKLDFNEFNSAVLSVYELYPTWNASIVQFYGKF